MSLVPLLVAVQGTGAGGAKGRAIQITMVCLGPSLASDVNDRGRANSRLWNPHRPPLSFIQSWVEYSPFALPHSEVLNSSLPLPFVCMTSANCDFILLPRAVFSEWYKCNSPSSVQSLPSKPLGVIPLYILHTGTSTHSPLSGEGSWKGG